MQKAKTSKRKEAINRGLEFIYRIAREPERFSDWGSDLLNCFYFISQTSLDPDLRRKAKGMGKERALRWRRDNQRLPQDAEADTILDFIYGSYAADKLGFRDPSLKEQIRTAARRFQAKDYIYFDPVTEPPPTDVPQQCVCEFWNDRGRKTCRECKRRLKMMTRYAVWYDALIRIYSSERFGINLGARYSDVIKWLPTMRPYRGRDNERNPEFYDTVYAVTHIIYTLNDYSIYRLSPRWLPQEFAFLKKNLHEAIKMEDPEMVGELLDSLKGFGLKETHPLVERGVDYLLSCQNPDGSWGDTEEEETYQRYHPTWTAIDGLREYRWKGVGISFPELRPLLRRWAKAADRE